LWNPIEPCVRMPPLDVLADPTGAFEDAADAIGVDARTLQRRFERYVG